MKPAKQLAVAAAREDLDAMRALLAETPQLAREWQPIMDACYAGRAAAVELLLDHGADPNIVSKSTFRYRPLHRTVERKVTEPRGEPHLEVARLLLERGADPTLRGSWYGVTATALAAFGGDPRFVAPLAERTPEPDLYTAAALGATEQVRELVERDPDAARNPDTNGWSAVRYCARSRMGHSDPAAAANLEEIVRLLLEHGAPADGALEEAVYLNNAAVTRLLLEHGAELRDGDTLNHAACDGSHDTLALLVARGTDLDLTAGTEHHGGYTPFGCTLTIRSVRGATWFLDHGIDPNHVGGPSGESSLHVAVRNRAGVPLLKLLVERGADPNARDAAGATPLAAAREKQHRKAIEYLEQLGAEA